MWPVPPVLSWLGTRQGRGFSLTAEQPALFRGTDPGGRQPAADGRRPARRLVSAADNGGRKLSLPRRHTGRLLSPCHRGERNSSVTSELHPKTHLRIVSPPRRAAGSSLSALRAHSTPVPLLVPADPQLVTSCW